MNDFSWALQELKEGRAVTRKRKGSWHLFIRKYKWEEMETIHTQIMERHGSLAPRHWSPDQDEILATDWLNFP